MSSQAEFASGLLAADGHCPAGLVSWNGSAAEARFAVYRNNVIVGLVDALTDSFPVTQALVGEEFFRAMAREHVRAFPPRSPVLALYGEDFTDFIASFEPARALPYLADLARLEYLRVLAWHAADADAIAAERIAAVLETPDAVPRARFGLHPSLYLLRSAYGVVSLWAAHQADDPGQALAGIDPSCPEAALICRDGLDVVLLRLDPPAAALVGHLREGKGLGEAMAAASEIDPAFDPTATLALLLRFGAITAITTPRRHEP